jgi:predicted Fe-Mo cluster-binding NifX family protein
MKVAIPLFHCWVSPHFGYAQEILVATRSEGGEWKREKLCCGMMEPQERINLLFNLGVDTLVCGGINGHLQHYLEARGMRVLAGVMGEAEEALRMLQDGRLVPGAMLRGCGRARRWHHGPPWLWG